MRYPYDTSFADRQRSLRWPAGRIAYALLGLALIAAPFVLGGFVVGQLTYLVILCIACLGVMLMTGHARRITLGHAAFAGIGAYAQANLTIAGVPMPVALVLSALLAGACGWLAGRLAKRLDGASFALFTLALGFIADHLFARWTSLTGGHAGMPVPPPFGLNGDGPPVFYFVSLAVLVLVVWMMTNLLRGPMGRALAALGTHECVAATVGIDGEAIRLRAFALSAGCVGLAGALLAHHLRFITPDVFGFILSVELVLMVVVGGRGTLHGAIFGAVLIGMLPQLVTAVKPLLSARLAEQSGFEVFVFGAVLVLFVLFAPGGLAALWMRAKAFLAAFPMPASDQPSPRDTGTRDGRIT